MYPGKIIDKNRLAKDIRAHYRKFFPDYSPALTKRLLSHSAIFAEGVRKTLDEIGAKPMREEELYAFTLTIVLDYVDERLGLKEK